MIVATSSEKHSYSDQPGEFSVSPATGSDAMNFIPFARPSMGEEEAAAAADVVRSGWLTTGPKTLEFERQFSEFIGCKYAIAVNSATAGLHLGLEALGIGPGDKVITTPFTFTATAEVVRYLGADPIFADIDPESLNLDPNWLEKALAKHKAKAIIPMHYGGNPCEMDEILALANSHGCAVMSDAAHAFPAKYKGQLVGATADDISVFSFYANKTICTGEGGMIATDDDALARRMKVMRLHGIDRDSFERYRSKQPAWYYQVVAPGYKYNMPDLAAAIGLVQLGKAEKMRRARERIADAYSAAFQDCPLQLPVKPQGDGQHAWHLYPIQLDLQRLRINREQFIDELTDAGIGSSVHYIPLHMQPYWRERYKLKDSDFPVATRVYERIVSLPVYPDLTDQDVDRIVTTVKSILANNSI